MEAFFNCPITKQKYLTRMEQHIAADELVRGTGFDNGKGCFIGCTLNKYDHAQFEQELGVPEWLARVFDTLFEGSSAESAAWSAESAVRSAESSAARSAAYEKYADYLIELIKNCK